MSEQDGIDFIVMEFVSGRSLDALSHGSGLPLREALDYAIQIADGLAAAHAAGIVHRDIKPANIMITAEGRVKLLDFGLAKLLEADPLLETDPTRSMAGVPPTQESHIVGTLCYMSPEQVEGRKLDSRSDIFSFGAVFYEMLTGRRAFQGIRPSLSWLPC